MIIASQGGLPPVRYSLRLGTLRELSQSTSTSPRRSSMFPMPGVDNIMPAPVPCTWETFDVHAVPWLGPCLTSWMSPYLHLRAFRCMPSTAHRDLEFYTGRIKCAKRCGLADSTRLSYKSSLLDCLQGALQRQKGPMLFDRTTFIGCKSVLDPC